MRSDFGLYAVAVICFIIASLIPLKISPQLPAIETFPGTAITVIFTALGLIFIILGYSLRPKPIISIPEQPPPTPPPPSAPLKETPVTPPPRIEPERESVKPEKKKPRPKTRRKRTKRKRKKA